MATISSKQYNSNVMHVIILQLQLYMSMLEIGVHVVFLVNNSTSIAFVLALFLIANCNVMKTIAVRAMLHGISETPIETANLQLLEQNYVQWHALAMSLVT